MTGLPLRLSVVSCAFNEEKFLPRFLESVLSERGPSYQLIEIVVQTAGSTDKTNDIVRKFQSADPRIRLVTGTQRLGKVASLREAGSYATGDVVLVQNADTAAQPGCFEAIVETVMNTGTQLVCCRPVPDATSWGFANAVGTILWSLHDQVSRVLPKPGEAYALSRDAMTRLSEAIDDDDNLFSTLIHVGRISAAYAPAARISMISPRVLRDYIAQRLRVGRQTARAWKQGRGIPATWDPAVVALAVLRFSARLRAGDALPFAAFLLIEGSVRAWTTLESLFVRTPIRIWPMLESTKGG